MSQRALNPKQLAMFMPVREVIDTVHKIDSAHNGTGATPRQQWERPLPETSLFAGESLRDAKLAATEVNRELGGSDASPMYRGYDIDKGIAEKNLPPLRIQHFEHGGNERSELWDGHHRLAKLEEAGHAEAPVWHSFDEDEDTPKDWVGVPRRKP